MKGYRINVEHYDEVVQDKIENRNTNKYPRKMDYVLAAIRSFEDANGAPGGAGLDCADLKKRIFDLENRMDKFEKRVNAPRENETPAEKFDLGQLYD